MGCCMFSSVERCHGGLESSLKVCVPCLLPCTGGGAKNPEQEEQQRKTERRAARMILQGAKDLVNQKVGCRFTG